MSSPSSATNLSPANESTVLSSSDECNAHSGCAALNMQGQCCPTSDGVFLSCCNSVDNKLNPNNILDEWRAILFALYSCKSPLHLLLPEGLQTRVRDVMS